jgi:hypothetical protein
MTAGPKFDLSFEAKGIRDLPKLLKEWPDRVEHLRAHITYLACEWALEEIKSKIPRGAAYSGYREGLQMAEVMGTGPGESAFALYVDVRKSKVRKVDGPKTVLYVHAKRRSRRTPPEIAVLESFNPWTIDTLPLTPNKRWATVVSRKASKSQVAKVAKKRRRDANKWKKALAKVGIRQIKKDQGMKVDRKTKALPDVALDAIRLEFGLGSTQSKPHWRPAMIQITKGQFFKMLVRKDKKLKRAFTDSNFQEWAKWPKKITRKLRIGEVRKYKGFQKRLGIRAKK